MLKEYAKNKIIRVVGAAYLSCMVLCILFFLLSREKVVYEDNSVDYQEYALDDHPPEGGVSEHVIGDL